MQVASVDFQLGSDGSLVQRNSNQAQIKVVSNSFTYSGLNSNWNNSDLMQVQSIYLSVGQDSDSLFLSAIIDGLARIEIDAQTTVILFQTSLGRLILSGADLEPADTFLNGTFANIPLSQLYQKISNPQHGTYHVVKCLVSSF